MHFTSTVWKLPTPPRRLSLKLGVKKFALLPSLSAESVTRRPLPASLVYGIEALDSAESGCSGGQAQRFRDERSASFGVSHVALQEDCVLPGDEFNSPRLVNRFSSSAC